jgi:hypothetical protein
MLSTFHTPGTQMIRCKEKIGKKYEYWRLVVICDYTNKMSTVEQTDYYCCSYALMCARYKWWHKVYCFGSWNYVFSVASLCSTMCDSITTWSQCVTFSTRRCFSKNFWDVCNSSAQKRACLSTSDIKERLQVGHSSSKLKTVPLKIVLLCYDHNVKAGRKEIIFSCETCFR